MTNPISANNNNRKYLVYFNGGSHPYHKELTLLQAQKLGESLIPAELKRAGFSATAYIMDATITQKHGIAVNYMHIHR